jgi:YVTN family beta-propeller protein
VAFDDAGRRAFVTNQQGDSVSVIDLAALRVVATWPTAAYPEGIAFENGRLWVVSWMDDKVMILDAASGRELAQVPVGRNPRAFGAFLAGTGTRP